MCVHRVILPDGRVHGLRFTAPIVKERRFQPCFNPSFGAQNGPDSILRSDSSTCRPNSTCPSHFQPVLAPSNPPARPGLVFADHGTSVASTKGEFTKASTGFRSRRPNLTEKDPSTASWWPRPSAAACTTTTGWQHRPASERAPTAVAPRSRSVRSAKTAVKPFSWRSSSRPNSTSSSPVQPVFAPSTSTVEARMDICGPRFRISYLVQFSFSRMTGRRDNRTSAVPRPPPSHLRSPPNIPARRNQRVEHRIRYLPTNCSTHTFPPHTQICM